MLNLPSWIRVWSMLDLTLELGWCVLLCMGLIGTGKTLARKLRWTLSSPGSGEAACLILIPMLIFPVLSAASLLGILRPALFFVQALLVAFGVFWFATCRKTFKVPRDIHVLDAIAFCAVALFLVWGWAMPFAESFNGHHHVTVGLLNHLLTAGRFEFPPLEAVSYSNDIHVWPHLLWTTLALFTFPYAKTVWVHPMFFLPGIFAIVTLKVLRDLGREAGVAGLGSLTFLFMAFNYYAASEFTEITFDLYSPLLLAVGLALLIKPEIKGTVVLLAFSFLMRKQIFLFLGMALGIRILFMDGRASLRSLRSSAWLLILALFPIFYWSVLLKYHYGDAFFPHGSRAASSMGGLDLSRRLEELRTTKLNGQYNFFREMYFPVFVSKGFLVVLKNLFGGLSVSISVALGTIVFLVLGSRIDRRSWRAVAIAFASFSCIALVFFWTYPKYPHYWSPFGGFALAWIVLKKLPRMLGLGIGVLAFALGVYSWGYNSWGHARKDPTFRNVLFLWPGYGGPLERIARKASRDVDDLRREISQNEAALREAREVDARILYMEHEPGALVPSLMGEPYLMSVPYIDQVSNQSLTSVLNTKELANALRELRISHIVIPQRAHPDIEQSVLFRLIRSYQASPSGSGAYLVKAADLLR